MNRINYILVITLALGCSTINAQEAVHNYGAMQMHGSVAVGFHMDLINDGSFDQNSGLAGFYGYNKSLNVLGAYNPIFYDAEIAVDNGLFLDTGIDVINNGNLINGSIITPRTNTDVYTNFIDDAFYVGATDASLVDGYTALTNKDYFIFPIGDQGRLRPLTISSTSINLLAKCAYFHESPSAPSTFGNSFQTTIKSSESLFISNREFWHLEGDVASNVTLTWDDRSQIADLVSRVDDIKVVGWSKDQNMWVDLGNTDFQGDMIAGSVTSDTMVPDEYEIITLGGIDIRSNEFITIDLDNYLLTPNGDGKNDFLVLDGIENSPSNELKIFNRYGVMVYSKMNYQNEFEGKSNRKGVINRESGLQSGVYFYVITLMELRQRHQGYLYISADANN
jgi:gliding motility-associated-like protein